MSELASFGLTILALAVLLPGAVWFGIRIGEERQRDAVDRVVGLWERNRGWIPGGARKDLEEALGRPLRTAQEIVHATWDFETTGEDGRGGIIPNPERNADA